MTTWSTPCRPRRRPLRDSLWPVLVAAALAAPAAGQVRVQRLPAGGDVKDLNAVYVRDSGVANERLALAERMERLKEWDKSAAVYQEITDKYADRLIPTRTDAAGAVQQYVSVSAIVQERLAKWPEDGLAVYRGLYEETARDALAKLPAGDRAGLGKIFGQYFATESGKEAGLRLVRDSVERGEFAAGAWAGRRLLDLHPTLAAERPGVLFLTAIAEHLAGNTVAAEAHRQALAKDHAGATAAVRGKDAPLAEALAAELRQQPALARGARLDAWPLPYGTPDNAALPTGVSFGGARMFTINLPAPRPRATVGGLGRDFAARMRQDAANGSLTGIMPVVDRGELFFQDNARVYAVNLNSGLPLTGWQKSYPGEPRGAFTVDGSPASTPAGVLLPVSVTDDSVVALMSNIDKNAAQFGRLGHPPQLVVLDRATGKPRWTMRASGLKIANDDARLREGQLYGVPSVVGDTIYTLVRASRGGQFREVHVVALSLADGSVKWNSYLASTATNVEFGEFNGEIAPTGSVEQMAFSDGRLYVLSNIGALACFDAADGKTAWLNIYPRLDALTRVERRYMGDRPIPDKPFISNPPIVTDGKVFVMPSDSPSVLVYDAVTGEQLGTVPRTINERDDEKFDAVETLLRVVDNKLILGMRSGFLSVPWQKYDSSKTLVANGGRFRKTSIRGTSAEVDPVQGRPFVTDEYVFVPRVDQLQRLSIREMAIQGLYPESGNWDEATEGPGNVLATPDYLVIAGHNKIVVYADAAMAAAKLDEQIERDPTAVEPKLRYAELMFVAGRPKDAIGWLDKAIATLGGEKNLPHGTARDRLFDVASNYAVKIPGEGAAASALTRELFARARIAADTPQQQVRYRQAHAAMLRKAADGAGEMALHREILANAEWRRQPVSGKGGTVTAASDAEVAIGELAKIDASAFARFAADAESAFAALGTGAAPGDAAALIELSDTFPATPAAVRATGAAAAIYEDAREYRAAGQTLRRLLKYVGANDRAAALESLARVYLRMPAQLDAAIARVDQLQQLAPAGRHSKPMTLADGRAVAGATYAELATELRKHRTSVVDAALPTFGLLPSTGGGAAKKPELMAPEKLVGVAGIIAQAGRTRPDRVVIWQDDNKINQVAAGGVAPLHPPVALPGVPRSAAYAGDTLIAVGSDSVSAISPAGALLWQVPVRGLPDAEVSRTEVATDTPALRDPAGEEGLEAGDPGNGIRIQRGRLGGVGGRIRLNGNMAGIGEAAVAIDTGEETIAYLSVLSDRVVFATGRGRVAAIDLASGRVVWQLRPAEAGLRKMAASEDFVVVATGEEAGNTDVTVLDTITGQALRRTSYEAARNQRFVNLALSPGGMLVTMLTNALVGRDLYDPAASGWDRQATANFNEPVFAGAAGERQLVLSDDRVLAVATINGQQHVRAYDLATGKPLMAQGGKPGTAVEAAFTAAPAAPGNESPLSITAVGPAFYVYTPTALASYHLDKKDWRWAAKVGATIRGTFRDLLLSKDYAVMVNGEAAANINTEKLPAVQLNVFSRALSASGNESGLLERHPSIRDPAGILVGQWQLAEGAFYYVAGNKTLTMLKPNR